MAGALDAAAGHAPHAGVGVVGADGELDFLTYPRFAERAHRMRGGLHEAGIAAGDTVIVRVSGIADYLLALWACLTGGIRPVAVHGGGDRGEDADRDRLAHAWRVLGEPVVLTDSPVRLPGARTLSPRDCRDGAAVTGPAVVDADDVAMYLLSSGSTGRGKVIPLTHRGLVELGVGARHQIGMDRGDTALNWMPLDHSGALLLYHFTPVFVGASNLHAATDWVLADPSRWLNLAARHRVHHTWAPNFGYRLATERLRAAPPPPDLDLRGVKTLVSGGEQILETVMDDFLAATAGFGVTPSRFRPCWGMTETTTAITFGRYDRPGAVTEIDGDRFVSVGSPAPGARCRVVDATGRVLPQAHVGALQLQSARVTPGYVGDPEADRETFTDDGWLNTGDLAHLEDGQVTITGRLKDVIILNGDNHSCHRIEEIAATVPGVRAGLVAAVGVPDAERGTESLAVVYVPETPQSPQPDAEIRALLARRLRLSATTVVAVAETDFPRTGSGKVQRAEIRRRLLSGELAAPATAASPVAGRAAVDALVLSVFDEVLGERIDPHLPLYEQGVDSIRLPRLAEELTRRLSRPVTGTTLLAHPTVAALCAALSGEAPAAPRPEAVAGDGGAVAIVGMAARFPGADSIDAYWRNLCHGVDSVRFFGPAELAAAGVPAAEYLAPGYVAASGALGAGSVDTIKDFDAELFGISAREAELLDPQQRLFLEMCLQALEHAGYAGAGDADGVAVFAGSGMNLYSHQTYLLNNLSRQRRDPLTAMQVAMGNQPDFLATRVAYRLGLTGPAVTVQTACSSALVAVHQAVRALASGQCGLALAGAAAVHVPQASGYTHVDGTMMSRTGRCRPFDAAADGTVGGNGVAAVLLKRLDEAVADGDTVHAVILGSAVNNDGADKVGFTAPSVSGQTAAIVSALDSAGVTSDTIGYVEAHGTGTRLGDPLEVRALTEAFTARAKPADTGTPPGCVLGSVKANIGHLDSCAGMAGLIKTVLVLKHGLIPPQINFDTLNPGIDLSDGPFRVATAASEWPDTGTPRRAAVQALGVGGTNAHVVLQQAPATAPAADHGAPGLLLSGHRPRAVTELAGEYVERLRRPDAPAMADLFTTTARGRRHRKVRLAVMADSVTELADALEAHLSGLADPRVVTGETTPDGPGPTAFAFSGQTALPGGFATELADRFALFADVLGRCVRRHRAEGFGDLRPVLLEPGATSVDTAVIQPALFAYQVALAGLLSAAGLRPDVVLGHSVGEYAAWCVAGAISVEDGLRLTAARGALMSRLCPEATMIAVRADRRTVEAVRAVVPGLELAVVNGPGDHVLGGDPEAVTEAAELLRRRDITATPLAVRRAFHTSSLDAMLPRFAETLDTVELRAATVPVVSTMDGRLWAAGSVPDRAYLLAQARRTVRFDLALATVRGEGVRRFVEVGPQPVLAGIGRRTARDSTWLTPRTGVADVFRTLATAHCDGVAVDWSGWAHTGSRVPLPTHPFHRKTHWIDAPDPSVKEPQ